MVFWSRLSTIYDAESRTGSVLSGTQYAKTTRGARQTSHEETPPDTNRKSTRYKRHHQRPDRNSKPLTHNPPQKNTSNEKLSSYFRRRLAIAPCIIIHAHVERLHDLVACGLNEPPNLNPKHRIPKTITSHEKISGYVHRRLDLHRFKESMRV